MALARAHEAWQRTQAERAASDRALKAEARCCLPRTHMLTAGLATPADRLMSGKQKLTSVITSPQTGFFNLGAASERWIPVEQRVRPASAHARAEAGKPAPYVMHGASPPSQVCKL